MVLDIVKYGDPVLRKKGEKIADAKSPETQKLIDDMFETMEAAHGVGLAAQQIGKALQLCVIDIRAVEDRPSTLELEGKEADPASIMPLTLINPEFTPVAEPVAGPEGCLSFPEMYADITRPEKIDLKALDRNGNPLAFRCGGLLARAIQHEYDHLQGVLFIDRMQRKDKEELKPELEALHAATKRRLAKK